MTESCKLHNYKLKIVICILFLFVLLPNQLCQAKQKENNNIVLSHSGTNYGMKLYYTDISLLNFYFLYYYCLDSHIITSCFEDPQTIINEIKKAYNLYYSSDISYIGLDSNNIIKLDSVNCFLNSLSGNFISFKIILLSFSISFKYLPKYNK